MSQPTLEPLRRWDPDQIGPYTLLGRLGAGAMGQVYLGRSTAGRLVAVKTIKIELAEEPGFRARFAREVAAARRVSGVFTAAVVAANPEAEMPWLATAYVPAPTLSKLVRVCGPLPVPSVLWLAAGCAEALESIHLAGLVHRDLKPSNVLVAPDGPRVIDFGVARAAERVQLTVTRGAVGTPAYMAPEQARDSQHASPASDVYSLGATLLFAATGHGPYQGDTVMDVLVKLATEQPDLSALPAELASLIVACLERSPRHRPTSAALLDGLGPFVEASADPADAHNYLPGSAMALIAEYQRSPQPAVLAGSGPDAAGEDPTSASHTGLTAAQLAPATQRQQRRRKPSTGDARNRPAARPAHAAAAAGPHRPGRVRGGPRGRRAGPRRRVRRPQGRPRAGRDAHLHGQPRAAHPAAGCGPAADAGQRYEHDPQADPRPGVRGREHGLPGARQRLRPRHPGRGLHRRERVDSAEGAVDAAGGRAGDRPEGHLQLHDRSGPRVLPGPDPGRHVPRRGQGRHVQAAGHQQFELRPRQAAPTGPPPTGGPRRRRASAHRARRPPPPAVARSKAPASTTGPPAASTRPDRSAGPGHPG